MSSNLERHTAHSSPSFDPLSEENLKKGSDSITALSIPDNCDLDLASPRRASGSPWIADGRERQSFVKMRRMQARKNIRESIPMTAPRLGWKFESSCEIISPWLWLGEICASTWKKTEQKIKA